MVRIGVSARGYRGNDVPRTKSDDLIQHGAISGHAGQRKRSRRNDASSRDQNLPRMNPHLAIIDVFCRQGKGGLPRPARQGITAYCSGSIPLAAFQVITIGRF
jgi:hypothetical protein